MSAPDVRVGIVSWNTGALLDRCLAALPAALGSLQAEVVVVDNDSPDDSAEVAARHDVELIVNAENVGYAKAMNQALAGTDAPVLIALNPDTEPPPGSIEALVERLHAEPHAGIVAPVLVHPAGQRQHSAYRFPSIGLALVVCFAPAALQRGRLGERWRLEAARAPDAPGPVDWVIGAVHVIRRSSLRGEAPYSERWFMYAEDLELCWRLARDGAPTVLVPDVVIPHAANAAGAQAWGTERDRRWWAATYDAYLVVRGPGATRRWAVVNSLGVLFRLVLSTVLARLPGARGLRHRRIATALRRVLGVHLAAVRDPDAVGVPARAQPR